MYCVGVVAPRRPSIGPAKPAPALQLLRITLELGLLVHLVALMYLTTSSRRTWFVPLSHISNNYDALVLQSLKLGLSTAFFLLRLSH